LKAVLHFLVSYRFNYLDIVMFLGLGPAWEINWVLGLVWLVGMTLVSTLLWRKYG
jgi:hypothetical protein